jgi:hypothetical protein
LYGRDDLLTVMVLKAVAWCALPLPQYDLPDDDDVDAFKKGTTASGPKIPGHGEARVEINFWFFLFVYYGAYNLTALMWITKVFNIYSLNWSVHLPSLPDFTNSLAGGQRVLDFFSLFQRSPSSPLQFPFRSITSPNHDSSYIIIRRGYAGHSSQWRCRS